MDLTSLNSYNFSGCGTTKTIGKITPARKPNIQYVNGDGTVPLFSSDIKAKENYYVSGYEHAELPSANGVPQDILSIIKGETKLDFINISDNQDFCKISGKTVSVHSPVSLDIYDENNNHTGVVSGGNIEYGVSGVSFDEIEGEKFAFLPDGINYKIILNGEATGTFEFDIDSVSGEDQITNTESWTNVPIEGTSSKFEIDIATSSEHFVISDEKGDGNLVELPEGYDGSARDKSSVKRLGRRGTPSESTTTDSVFTGIAKPARPTLLGGQSSINSSLIQDMVEPNTTSSVFASKAKQSRLIPINIKKIQKDNLATSSNIKTTASVLDSGGSGYFSRFFHYIGDFISKIFHKVVK